MGRYMHPLDWAVMGLYGLVMVAIGLWSFRKVKDTEDFFAAGGKLPWWLSGVSHHMISKDEAPKSWEDLLHPRWKGKIAMDTEPDVMIEGLISAWGQPKTEEYLKKLARQNILLRRGHTLITQLL